MLNKKQKKLKGHFTKGCGSKSMVRALAQEYNVSENAFLIAMAREMRRNGIQVSIHSLAHLICTAAQTLHTDKTRNPLAYAGFKKLMDK